MSDFTEAIVDVMRSDYVKDNYPDGIEPAEILKIVWDTFPGEFQLCTVIDVCHEKENVYG